MLKALDLCPAPSIVLGSPKAVGPCGEIKDGVVVGVYLEPFSAASSYFISAAAEGQLEYAQFLP